MWQRLETPTGKPLYVSLGNGHVIKQSIQSTDSEPKWMLVIHGEPYPISEDSKDALLAGLALEGVPKYRAMVGRTINGNTIIAWDACTSQVFFADGTSMDDDKAFKALNP
jgi:hypothetical protein